MKGRRLLLAVAPLVTRQGPGGQLAAGPQGTVHADAADVLAESRVAFDPAAGQRHVDDPTGKEGRVAVRSVRAASVRTALASVKRRGA